jgi:ubiquinone/menaquinone biosynthesis C-methylase UbiE
VIFGLRRHRRAKRGGAKVKALLASFGGSAAYVAGVILTVILILIVWAFRQGRQVEFWPPKIGSRPDYRAAARITGEHVEQPARRQGTEFARIFEIADAAQFYQVIAPNYDQRNSVNLLATHMEVISRIDEVRKMKPALRVLDLGGGTGQNVATYFFNDRHIRWTYVDSCPAMLSQLQLHLAGRQLYERLRVHLEDINRVHAQLPARSYDVVLLNLVLSSMPVLPDFTKIAGLIPPGGQLIVADINPLYTGAHPYYKATAADGTAVAMRTHPVQPLEVVTRVKEAGLQLSEMAQVGSDAISYSFVITFASTTRPDEDCPRRDDEALPA